MTDKDFELLLEKAKGFQEAIDEVKADTNSMQNSMNYDKASRMKKLDTSLYKITEIMQELSIEEIEVGVGDESDNRILRLHSDKEYKKVRQAYLKIDGIQGQITWWNLNNGDLSAQEYYDKYKRIEDTLFHDYKAYHYPDWKIFHSIIDNIDETLPMLEQEFMYVIEAELQDRMQKALNENKKAAIELKNYKFN